MGLIPSSIAYLLLALPFSIVSKVGYFSFMIKNVIYSSHCRNSLFNKIPDYGPDDLIPYGVQLLNAYVPEIDDLIPCGMYVFAYVLEI